MIDYRSDLKRGHHSVVPGDPYAEAKKIIDMLAASGNLDVEGAFILIFPQDSEGRLKISMISSVPHDVSGRILVELAKAYAESVLNTMSAEINDDDDD